MCLQPLQQLVARLADAALIGLAPGQVAGHAQLHTLLRQDGSQQFGQLFALCVAVEARPAGVLSRLGLFLFFGAEAPIAALPLL